MSSVTKKRTKKRTKRPTQKNKRIGGGVFNFAKEVSQNIVINEIKPKDIDNLNINLVKYNKTYVTIVKPDNNIEYKVFYITPQTLVYNNINSARVPTFFINDDLYNIKIKNRFVNFFVRIGEEWYAILRIFFAINTGLFASVTYTIFYKLNNGVIQFDNFKNSININPEYFINKDEFTLGVFKGTKKTLRLNTSAYEPITKKSGDIYLALRKFRNVQLASVMIKGQMADEVIGFD